jgi:Domain of unknown function (DUF4157)
MNFSSQRHRVGAPAAGSAPQSDRLKRAPGTNAAVEGIASNRAVSNTVSGGIPLDPRVRGEMEARFGTHFENVRIHDDDEAHRHAAELGSKAYTVGSDIVFGGDRYAPHTAEGKRLLAHELAHVVQQRRGGDMPGEGSEPALESDASAAADAFAAGATQVAVEGASSPGVMHDKDDRRRKRGKGRYDDDDGRQKKAQRDQAKRDAQQRKQERAAAGKDDQQIREERAEKKLRSLERDAKRQGAKSRSPASKNKALKSYEDVLRDAGGSQLDKNKRKGAMDELQRTPRDVAGAPQDKFVAGGPEVPGQELRPGMESYAQPDYSIYRRHPDGRMERLHVNLKSDKLYLQTPSKARATARANTKQAIRNARHLPGEEKIIISYGHTPDPEIQRIMLDEHFGSKNPISEVRFGTTTYTRSTYKPTPAKGKANKKSAPKKRSAKKSAKAKSKQGLRKKGQSKSKSKAKGKAKNKAKGAKQATTKDRSKARDKVQGKDRGQSKTAPEPEAKQPSTEHTPAKPESQAVTDKPTASGPKPEAKPTSSGAPPVGEAAAPAKPVVEAKPVEPPKPAPIVERGVVPEMAPKGRGPAIGPFEVLGFLGAIPAAKDIRNDIREGNYGSATAKAALLRLSFVAEAAPPLLSAAVISTYWGERHEKIQEDAFAVGEAVEEFAEDIPIVGSIPYAPKVLGALEAANVAVMESIGYTALDMGEAIGEGAEDLYDWLTEPVLSEDEMKLLFERYR